MNELPAEVPWDLAPPEGDQHRKAKARGLDALGGFFRKLGRKVYVSSELAVFYPDERRFAPDLMAVLDVEPYDRDKWVVSAEGKGLDFVVEILVHGDSTKDLTTNVERYARLGISEYFVFEVKRARLVGYQLSEGTQRYRPVVPQDGRYHSRVLGLDLAVEGERIRFYLGTASVLESEELLLRANAMLEDVLAKSEEAARLAEREAERARSESSRADEAEQKLAKALAEIERLRKRL